MSANHDLYLDLCAALAVGSIEPQDQRVLEEHLAGGCAECHALLLDLAAPLEALALALPSVKPSRGLKARTLVAVAQAARGSAAVGSPAPEVEPERGLRALPAWIWAAAAVLLVAAGAGWWRAASLDERVAALEDRLASAPAPEPDAEAQWSAFLAEHPGARVIELAANDKGEKDRRARVAYDAASRRALGRFENFAAPAGRDFEVWTIRDGKPVSEGLVRVDARGIGLKAIENTGDPAALAAFAVSSEAAGGARDRQTPGVVAYVGGVPK